MYKNITRMRNRENKNFLRYEWCQNSARTTSRECEKFCTINTYSLNLGETAKLVSKDDYYKK